MEMWKDLADGDEYFQNKFARVFDNNDVKEDDYQLTPDSYDNYINTELALDQGGDQTEYAWVRNRLKENQGWPIGIALDNPILDTRMYEIEYQDGHTAALAANLVAENLFA